MCATCIASPDAPPIPVLIATIKRFRRIQRRAKWFARFMALVFGFFVCTSTVQAFQGAHSMLLLAAVHLALAWLMLKRAEEVAARLDHTKEHLRLTEALHEAE